jgi:hypothetical protein
VENKIKIDVEKYKSKYTFSASSDLANMQSDLENSINKYKLLRQLPLINANK